MREHKRLQGEATYGWDTSVLRIVLAKRHTREKKEGGGASEKGGEKSLKLVGRRSRLCSELRWTALPTTATAAR